MNGHADFSPSSSATWLACPYSARDAAPDDFKKQSTKDASDEGTRVHALLEMALIDGASPHREDPARDAVDAAVSFINKLEDGTVHSEFKITVSQECYGTTDVYNNSHQIATIFDLKNGKWDVDAYHNKQMMTYAAGLLAHNPAPWWRLVIFQPNGLNDNPFKQWVAHRSEIEAHRAKVIAATQDRSGPKPGPHCRWCKKFSQCEAMSMDANFVVGAVSRRPEDLTPNEIVRLLRLIRALGDVKDAYEDLLAARLKLGYAADGAALKPGRSFRAWNDQQQAATVLFQHYGAKAIKPVSPAQAEKLGIEGKKYAAVGAHKPEAELKVHY